MADTGEGYPGDECMSRRTGLMVVIVFGATLLAISVTLALIALQPDVRRAAPTWADDFTRNTGEWRFEASGSIADGRLYLDPLKLDAPALAFHPISPVNFVAETQARASGGTTDNGYGIAVGDSTTLTAYLIGSDGYTSVMRRTDGEWREAQPWRQWPHVRHGGAWNTLRLECREVECAFYVNEEITTRLASETERSWIGLIAWRFAEERSTFEFDSVSIWRR